MNAFLEALASCSSCSVILQVIESFGDAARLIEYGLQYVCMVCCCGDVPWGAHIAALDSCLGVLLMMSLVEQMFAAPPHGEQAGCSAVESDSAGMHYM